jgi:hypothetical protein
VVLCKSGFTPIADISHSALFVRRVPITDIPLCRPQSGPPRLNLNVSNLNSAIARFHPRSIETILSRFNRETGRMNKALRTLLLLVVCSVLVSCDDDERVATNNMRLAADIHVRIADHALVLPFVALEHYAYRAQSFSPDDRKRDAERARNVEDELLRDAADSFDELAVVVQTYGWNDFDLRQREMCPLLTRAWARSVCDNPWAAIRQALPYNRFRLVDLRRLEIGDPRGPAHCVGEERRAIPQQPGEVVMVCPALVYGGDKDEFHHAVVRIDGELGALWDVWRYGQNGETAEAMTQREGQAIIAFVQYALGREEDFPTLHGTMCNLRRPKSLAGPNGRDCTN